VVDVDGYLRRLRLPHPGPPSASGLALLHQAHVEHIPYSTVDIQLGRPGSLDPEESVARIARTGRAGYCYQLNGALASLLGTLGYDVRRHRGSVTRDEAPSVEPFPNHLALTVHGLPTPDNPGGSWLVDAGLGDAIRDPVAMRPSTVRQGDFEYGLQPSTAFAGGWRLEHDPRGTFRAMDFESDTAPADAFASGHRYLSTAPQSAFVARLTIQRRDAAGIDKLISRSLVRIDAAGTDVRELDSRAELFEAVATVFGLTLDDLDEGDRDRLWQRAQAGHDQWLRAQDSAPSGIR
jgi:arylamine N-acetyltransferase